MATDFLRSSKTFQLSTKAESQSRDVARRRNILNIICLEMKRLVCQKQSSHKITMCSIHAHL
ncbi:hypothetical protein EXN66_Car010437 [Channa argus]|uniref:Uncharacterized protein n=1 Tax=Channa argus TaxID=215402 RepID=A0A6G1PWP3_CHAAH|nr:hypothetical protein EXN66_Car010437 [Channa argus]